MLSSYKFLIIIPLALLLIVAVAGCTANESSKVASVSLGKGFTAANTDADPEVDAIKVWVQPRDEKGNLVVANGHLEIKGFEMDYYGNAKAEIAYFSKDISKKDYRYEMLDALVPFKENYVLPQVEDVLLNSTFTTSNGKTYADVASNTVFSK